MTTAANAGLAPWCVVLGLLCVPSNATAQSAGPFGGLFGRTPERTGRAFTGLDFRTSIAAQVEDALTDDTLPTGGPVSGATGGASADLAFERRTDRLRLSLRGASTYQQFFQAPTFGAAAHVAGGVFASQIGTRLSVDAAANWVRSPFFQLTPTVPGSTTPEVLVPGEPFAARRIANDTIEAQVGLTSPYSKRSTLGVSVSRRLTRFSRQPDSNFEAWGARGLWTRQMSRSLKARVGYGREEIQHPALGDGPFVHEVLDLGVDLDRALSIARRTSLSLSTQTSMIRERGGERRYRLNGGAMLTRGFRRSWSAALGVNRTTEFLPGFLQPLFQDAASASIGGLFAPWLQWSATVAGGRGQVGFEGGRFAAYNASTRLTTGVTRHAGLYVQYAFYHYELPPSSTAVVLLPRLSRHSITAGLTVWVPIVNRVRVPRDPR